eukprot:2059010-Pyramimonas_sp.AAC.1
MAHGTRVSETDRARLARRQPTDQMQSDDPRGDMNDTVSDIRSHLRPLKQVADGEEVVLTAQGDPSILRAPR